MLSGTEFRRASHPATVSARRLPPELLPAILGVVGCAPEKPVPHGFWSLDATEEDLERKPQLLSCTGLFGRRKAWIVYLDAEPHEKESHRIAERAIATLHLVP